MRVDIHFYPNWIGLEKFELSDLVECSFHVSVAELTITFLNNKVTLNGLVSALSQFAVFYM